MPPRSAAASTRAHASLSAEPMPIAAADAGAAAVPPDALAGFRFTIVPHTHWDREWYLPFETFRMKLARVIDEAMDVLEADPRFTAFTLDGQAVICEDYAELRPDGVERLRGHLTTGRLVTGPSYVLPDEFLAGQEALVRNLLLGREVTRRFGGEPMRIGYLPDTFGHVAQLPQILRGFGLDTFVFWRGLGDEAADVGLAFTWRAPDGSDVLAIRQLGGYGFGNQLGRWIGGGGEAGPDAEAAVDVAGHRLSRFVRVFDGPIARSGTREILVTNGNDHEPIHAALPDIVDRLRARHPATEIEIGTYLGYAERLRGSLAPELPAVEGELAGGRDAPLLRGINSARMPLKQAAARAERSLLVAETLTALAILSDPGYAPPLDALRRAWREHLRNLPHDSISGCSIDEVHRDMLPRWVAVERLTDRVTREATSAMAGIPEPWTYRRPLAAAVAVVNPLPWPRSVLANVPLPADLADEATLVDVAPGRPAPVERVEVDGRPHARVAVEVPGFGAVRVALAPGHDAPGAAGAHDAPGAPGAADFGAFDLGPASITNGLVEVAAAPDGSLTIRDRRTGRTVAGIGRLEDVADRGDEYNFCPLARDREIGPDPDGVSVRTRDPGPLTAELEIRIALELPAELSADRRRRIGRVACPVTTVVRLTAGSPRVELTTTVENRARDHRLRVRFPAPVTTFASTVRAEGHFDVVERPARPVWSGAGWTEPPAPTNHTAGFVAAGDVAVFAAGLPEYEAVVTTDTSLELALTLLRCVGWLSRDDLATRPGEAGPQIETPEAQCLGTHVFEYAVELGALERSNLELLRASADYRTPPILAPAVAANGRQPLELGGELAFAALKPADDGDGVILRVHNPATRPAGVEIRGEVAVGAVRLDETPLATPPAPAVAPGEIRTYRLRATANERGAED